MRIDCCVFNIENFFIDEENFINSDKTPLKSEKKIIQLAQVVNEINADIYALSEVGGLRSLEIFNELHLNNLYIPIVLKGNSDRGIELGYLIKKSFLADFNLKYEIKNYTNSRIDFKSDMHDNSHYYLSRDLVELRIVNSNNNLNELILLNIHLKSQIDSTRGDFRSEKRRKSEFEFCAKTFQELHEQNPSTPIFLVGDFNGNASRFQTDPEFMRGVHTYELVDVLDLFDLPREQRATYYLFNGSKRIPIQLDYAFTKKEFLRLVHDATVYRYKNDLGNPKFTPRSRIDIWDNASDHYPLVFTIKTLD